jgi:chromosome segregation ATPase
MSENIVDLEQKADDLVNVLSNLKDEVEGYDEAKKSLVDVKADINNLTHKLNSLAADVLRQIKLVREIGPSELHSAISENKEYLLEVEKGLEESNAKIVSIKTKIDSINSDILSANKKNTILHIILIILVSILLFEYWN